MHALLKRRSTRVVLIALVAVLAAGWFLKPKAAPPFRGSGQPMKAILYHEYGPPDVLRFEATEKPLPNDNQVLIKVHAAAANPLDWHYMRGTPYLIRMSEGLRRPADPRLGTDVSGVVELVGKDVTRLKPGDEVFGVAGGAYAEYARTSEKNLVLKPAHVSFEQAAAVPVAAITALQALRDKGHLQAGQKVLINGASGGVGTFAVQIAKSFGAEVTGVCSTRNVEMVRSIGADHVVDYTKEDFSETTQRYDVVLDTVGNRPLSTIRRVMTPKGVFIGIGGGGPDAGNWIGPFAGTFKAYLYSPFVSQQFGTVLAEITTEDLTVLKDLMDAKKVTPVIDRTYPLSETAAAIRYIEAGHTRGKVVVTVATQNSPSSLTR